MAIGLLAMFAGCRDVPIEPVAQPIYGPPDSSRSRGHDTVKPGDRPGLRLPPSNYLIFDRGDGASDKMELEVNHTSDVIKVNLVDSVTVKGRLGFRLDLKVEVQMDERGPKVELKTQNKNKLNPILATLRIKNKEFSNRPGDDTVRLIHYPAVGSGFSLSCYNPSPGSPLYFDMQWPSPGIATVRLDRGNRMIYVSVRGRLNTSGFDYLSVNFDYRLSY